MIQIFSCSKEKNVCTLSELSKPVKNSWINIVAPTTEEISFAVSEYGIQKYLLDEVLDVESVPHIEKETTEGYISIILRVPVALEGNGVVTIPLGIIFLTKKKQVITICEKENAAITKLINKPPKKFSISNNVSFFRFVLRRVIASYMIELFNIEKEVREAEKSIKEALENKEIAKLLSTQKTLVYFKTSMLGNKTVLNKICSGRITPLTKRDKELFADLTIDIDEAQQLIAIYTEIITNTMSAYGSIVSNNLNAIMKVLALLTIAISIPTMIASFYGMNVDLPLQKDPIVFLYIVLTALSLTGVGFLYFKYKKWF
jgi:magnesium transporter